ncbi:hypothetical protein LPY66_10965 [Dehalobacter sp. DCM]|uniref:hypothetical protein n=1 Tax=Dehalobacter sp. DCM TaxID=2907827 RepID=UPI0030817775|nr:hypothetical protein LPY66_10965 [Dehalobacter sp. DCM]
MVKKAAIIVFSMLLIFSLAACGSAQQGKYKDGIYYAQGDGYEKGYEYFVKLEVKKGKIVSAEWNAFTINGGKDKLTLSKDGQYPMVANGGAQAEWHEQASKTTAYLIETQDPTKIAYKDNEGHTDDIAGVSIHVNGFFELAQKALAGTPVAKGAYKDGIYYAQDKAFEKGFKTAVNIVVVNGTIVGADWDAIAEKEDDPDKDALSKSGGYPMVKNGGAQADWHVQAQKAEAYLLSTQDPSKINYKDAEGHTDDIAGVSIHVSEFFTLAQEALANAK